MTHKLENLFLFLQGHWDLDRSSNGHGKMKGRASFTPLHENPLSHLYREEGEHRLETGECLSFFKEYIYEFKQFYIEVYFSQNKRKGTLFHRLTFSESSQDCRAQGEHLCGKDLYVGTYHFFDPKNFRIQYDITGPKKNISIQTCFRR